MVVMGNAYEIVVGGKGRDYTEELGEEDRISECILDK
jgi:hypothetical protein